jgi:hypothetical protein
MRGICALVAALLLFGCATGMERYGRPFQSDRIAQIEPGVTTRAEVLGLLGPPVRDPRNRRDAEADDVAPEPIERALYWEYRERRERFGSAILFTYFSQETLTDSLMVVFDENDVVQIVAVEQETNR